MKENGLVISGCNHTVTGVYIGTLQSTVYDWHGLTYNLMRPLSISRQCYGGRHWKNKGFTSAYSCRGRLPKTAERCWYPRCGVRSTKLQASGSGGEKTLPTFNTLHGANKHIIFFGSSPAKRWISGKAPHPFPFRMGQFLAIFQSPDYETANCHSPKETGIRRAIPSATM